jgi:hypothetical protein
VALFVAAGGGQQAGLVGADAEEQAQAILDKDSAAQAENLRWVGLRPFWTKTVQHKLKLNVGGWVIFMPFSIRRLRT